MADNGDVPTTLVRPEQGSVGERHVQWSDFAGRIDGGRAVSPATAADIEDMLRRDGRARAIEQALTLPIRSATHHIEGPDSELVEQVIRNLDTPLDVVIAQMAGAAVYARAFFELPWQARDGIIAPTKIAFRPSSTCKLTADDRTGDVEGFEQWVRRDNASEQVKIDRWHSLVVIHARHLRPLAGRSDLETVHALYTLRQKARYLHFDFLENQSMPKAIAKHSSDDPDGIAAFARTVSTLKGGGVVGIGPEQSVTPYESSGRGAAEFEAAQRSLAGEMADSVLAGFLSLPLDGKGSYALSKDQTDLFLLSRQGVLSEIAADFNRQFVDRVLAVNRGVGAVGKTALRFDPLSDSAVRAAYELLTSLGPAPEQAPEGFMDGLWRKVGAQLGIEPARVDG